MMNRFYFSAPLGNDRELCLAPLTERRIEMSGQDIEDNGEYFLYEKTGTGEQAKIEIIARAVSEEAALRMSEMFDME